MWSATFLSARATELAASPSWLWAAAVDVRLPEASSQAALKAKLLDDVCRVLATRSASSG